MVKIKNKTLIIFKFSRLFYYIKQPIGITRTPSSCLWANYYELECNSYYTTAINVPSRDIFSDLVLFLYPRSLHTFSIFTQNLSASFFVRERSPLSSLFVICHSDSSSNGCSGRKGCTLNILCLICVIQAAPTSVIAPQEFLVFILVTNNTYIFWVEYVSTKNFLKYSYIFSPSGIRAASSSQFEYSISSLGIPLYINIWYRISATGLSGSV